MKKLLIPSFYIIGDVTYMSQYILEYCSSLIAADSNLKALYDKLQALYSDILLVLEASGKSGLTEKLKTADAIRDQGFVGFRDQLSGAAKSLITERAATAQELYATIEQLGTQLYNLGYKAETAHLESLFKTFDQANTQEQLTELGLLADYQALKDAHAAFAGTQQERYTEQTEAANASGPAGVLAGEIVPVIENIVAYLQLFSSLNAAVYKDTYDNTLNLINQVNATARARKTRTENAKVDEGASDL